MSALHRVRVRWLNLLQGQLRFHANLDSPEANQDRKSFFSSPKILEREGGPQKLELKHQAGLSLVPALDIRPKPHAPKTDFGTVWVQLQPGLSRALRAWKRSRPSVARQAKGVRHDEGSANSQVRVFRLTFLFLAAVTNNIL
jgi:hypothetical protein